ncbi:BNR repeat-like domain protein [anaerobic digester metagenome]
MINRKFLFLAFIFSWYYGVAQHQNILLGNFRDPNEPSIYIDPKNPDRMMVGVNIDTYYISDDGGYTWSEGRLFSSTLGVWGDPCIVIDTLGNYYFFHLSNPPGPAWIDQIVCQKSTDYGATWNNGKGIGLDGSKAQDKEWAAVNPLTNEICLTWTQFDEYGSLNPNDSSIIRFSKSIDQGETWSNPVRLNRVAGDCIDGDNTVEGAVPVYGPEGEIYVAWAGPGGIMFDRSTDGGNTWLDQDIFVSDQPGGWNYSIPGIYRANGMPVTCCDISNGPDRGTIYINWSDQRNGFNDTDIWLAKSTDGGLSWSAPIRVNDDEPGKHQFFTWMTIDQSNGNLWFVFYDRRNYQDENTDVFLAFSEDGGESFLNFRVSESPFIPNQNIFFGDYTNIAVQNGVIRPVWTRLHDNQLSILTAIVDDEIVGISAEESLKPAASMTASPNPFSRTSAISFRLKDNSRVSLTLYDLFGRKVLNIMENQMLPAGKYLEHLDPGSGALRPGVYLLRLSSGTSSSVFKIVYSP